jgi:hypothetical protein
LADWIRQARQVHRFLAFSLLALRLMFAKFWPHSSLSEDLHEHLESVLDILKDRICYQDGRAPPGMYILSKWCMIPMNNANVA